MQQRWTWKDVNTKRKTESDIRTFKDWISTVEQLRNTNGIGVEEITMDLARYFCQRTRNPNRITNLIHWNVAKLPSVDMLVMANVDIHAIVSTIENYENRTVTPICVNNNSVQSTVTNNNYVQQTVIDLAPSIPTFPIIKYLEKCDNKCLWHKW